MTIEYRRNSNDTNHVCMTSCPFCGMEFTEGAGMQRTSHIMNCEEADDVRG